MSPENTSEKRWSWQLNQDGKIQIRFKKDDDSYDVIGEIYADKGSGGKKSKANAKLIVRCLNEMEPAESKVKELKILKNSILDVMENRVLVFDAATQTWYDPDCAGTPTENKEDFVHPESCINEMDNGLVGKALRDRKQENSGN